MRPANDAAVCNYPYTADEIIYTEIREKAGDLGILGVQIFVCRSTA